MAEYIERDEAINRVFEAFADGRSAYIALETIPAADVRPVVRGKWKPSMRGTANGPIQGKDEWYGPLFLCSQCGADMIGASNFCPNCGADMREES